MKRLWLSLLLVIISLVLMDAGFSVLRWWAIDSCQDRGLQFDYSRQACSDKDSSTALLWWSANQTPVRSLRTFALAGFFTFSVVLIRRNRAAT